MNVPRFLLLLTCAALTEPILAQQGGFIAGIVHDRSGGTVGGAEVRVQNEATGTRQNVYCDDAGSYSTTELTQGTYKLIVRRDGFRTITRMNLNVPSGKTLKADFVIDVLPLEQEVTVAAAPNDENVTASGLAVSRESPQASLPANGRDVHALFAIIPGATITPASISGGGQFTVSGQRPNANSFRIDGVSGNVGIGIISVPGAFPGTTLPGMTTIGSMQSLASKEETQRVDLRSADFAASSGDRPGAQISIETRSGANEFHGSAFGYLRPEMLDSHDWFSQSVGANLPPASLNGWGGAFGGPIWRNHTFFFSSFEHANVHDRALQLIPVPTAAARDTLASRYGPFLDSFPLASGPALSATQAVGNSPLQKSAAMTNASIRLDQTISSHVHIFARLSHVPSTATSIELGTAYSHFGWLSATGGMNLVTSGYTQEFRFNFSQATASAEHNGGRESDRPSVDAFLGAISIPTLTIQGSGQVAIVPPGAATFNVLAFVKVTALSMAGVGQVLSGQSGRTRQKQREITYVIAKKYGRHDLRAGGDYTRLLPIYGLYNNELSVASEGIDALLSGVPLGFTTSFFIGPDFNTQKYPFFAQDTIRINDRLQLLLGIRWEATPAIYVSSAGYDAPSFSSTGYWRGTGTPPVLFDGYGSTSQGAHWPTHFNQFAPRAGLAYHLKTLNLVLRAGAGIFYNTDVGSIIANTNPLSNWEYAPTVAAPTTSAITTAPSTNSILSLPRVLEWRTSLEKSFAEKSLFSLSYFGSSGQRLLRTDATITPDNGQLQSLAFTSHGASSYHALLTQFSGNVTPNLYALVSYTWSHSIDSGSADTIPFLSQPGYYDAPDRASSDFDVRHVFTASLNYRLPSTRFTPLERRFLGGWTAGSTLQARTGFPFDVTTLDRSVGLGFANTGRADVVAGEPLWIHNSAAPGGRQLNPAAFRTPSSGVNGNLGRNSLTGCGLFQFDLSLRRQFRLFRGVSMDANISAFNLLNHPSFADPVNYFGSALFGRSTSSTNLMLGSGSPTTGLTPLFQAGGPRTVELGLRFSF